MDDRRPMACVPLEPQGQRQCMTGPSGVLTSAWMNRGPSRTRPSWLGQSMRNMRPTVRVHWTLDKVQSDAF